MNCERHQTDCCSSSDNSKVCSSCRKIDTFSHPDILILFPVPRKIREENRRNEILKEGELHKYRKTEIISINDIRDIEESVLMKPFEAKRRVVIILDAETMKNEAQNAFLKLLEEPPDDTTIILTSSNPERLYSTIHSRCQRINFTRLSRNEMKEFLLKREEFDKKQTELILLLSNGSITKAKEILEDGGKRKLFKSIVVKNEYEKLKETFSKDTLKQYIEFLLLLFRDIFVAKTGTKMLNSDIERYIHSAYDAYSDDELVEIVELLRDSLINISRNVNIKLISNVIYDRIKEI